MNFSLTVPLPSMGGSSRSRSGSIGGTGIMDEEEPQLPTFHDVAVAGAGTMAIPAPITVDTNTDNTQFISTTNINSITTANNSVETMAISSTSHARKSSLALMIQ